MAATTEIGYAVGASGWWAAPSDEETPELRWPESVRVYDRMRRQDSQVQSVLRAVTLPVRRTPWHIDPAGARDEVVEFVAQDLGLPVKGQGDGSPPLRTRDRFSWAKHLQTAMLCLPMGHMFFEQVYRVEGTGAAARLRLRKLAPRMPRSISAINVADDGGLISIEQFAPAVNLAGASSLRPGGWAQPVTIPVSRLVGYVNDQEGGDWYGTSLLRTCYKNWLIKDRLLRVQAGTIERNGMGVPLYTGAPKETNLDAGRKMAQDWRSGEAAGAAVPDGADLTLRGVEGDLPDADPAIRYHDEQIARSALGHFLNLGTQTGSWALGTTFADFFTLSLQTVAEMHRDVAQQHIVEDLIDVNFGEDEPAPRLVFDEIGSRNAATAAAMKALIDAGAVVVDRPLEEHLRQTYGLPAKDDGTSVPPSAGAA